MFSKYLFSRDHEWSPWDSMQCQDHLANINYKLYLATKMSTFSSFLFQCHFLMFWYGRIIKIQCIHLVLFYTFYSYTFITVMSAWRIYQCSVKLQKFGFPVDSQMELLQLTLWLVIFFEITSHSIKYINSQFLNVESSHCEYTKVTVTSSLDST